MGYTSPKRSDVSMHFEQLKVNPYRPFSKADHSLKALVSIIAHSVKEKSTY